MSSRICPTLRRAFLCSDRVREYAASGITSTVSCPLYARKDFKKYCGEGELQRPYSSSLHNGVENHRKVLRSRPLPSWLRMSLPYPGALQDSGCPPWCVTSSACG